MSRLRRPWTLRTRLVVSAVSLIAVVAAVIGTVTAIAFQSYMYGKLDDQLRSIAERAERPPGSPPPGELRDTDALRFVGMGGQPFGTVGAVVDDGAVTESKVVVEDTGQRAQVSTRELTGAESRALAAAGAEGTSGAHGVDLPGLGGYRVEAVGTSDGTTILVPQVLMGVATAGVLYAAVRRRFSAPAGLITLAVFALTPVAALMFRFNNPDALLALLMTVTVYCVLRALENGRTKWLVWAGVAIGLAFLTKTLQAFLILPPLALLYAVCAPASVRKRLGQLALATGVMVVAGGWWVAIVELWPASSRPYIGGSQNNSFLELTFGYNGLGRLNGEETGSGGGGGGGGGGQGGGWGETGIGRMFNSEVGGQISWLLPAALILLVAGVWLTRKAKRTDTARAAFLAWGGALLMTALVFSFMAGIFHQYYTVALAPYIAALVGMGVTVLWEERALWWARAVLAGTLAVTVSWSYVRRAPA